MSAQVDHLEVDHADRDPVAVLDRAVHRDRQRGRVERMRDHLGTRHLDHLLQRLPVVAVLVGRDDRADRLVGDEREQPVGLRGGVDQHSVAGLGAAQQVGVVVERPDCQLSDRQLRQLAYVGGTADLDVTCIGHG